MAGRGPAPKPAHLRQRQNKKSSNATLTAPPVPKIPKIPNPDGRAWHALTVESWANAWSSPMASQWLRPDADALGRLAILWDDFYKEPTADGLKEIRLQSALFGLSPLDRSRLQWEVSRAEDAGQRATPPAAPRRAVGADPRKIIMMPRK